VGADRGEHSPGESALPFALLTYLDDHTLRVDVGALQMQSSEPASRWQERVRE